MTYSPNKIEVEARLIDCEATLHALGMLADDADSGGKSMNALLHMIDILKEELAALREALELGCDPAAARWRAGHRQAGTALEDEGCDAARGVAP